MPLPDSKIDMNILDSWHIAHKFTRKFLSSVAELSTSGQYQTEID